MRFRLFNTFIATSISQRRWNDWNKSFGQKMLQGKTSSQSNSDNREHKKYWKLLLLQHKWLWSRVWFSFWTSGSSKKSINEKMVLNWTSSCHLTEEARNRAHNFGFDFVVKFTATEFEFLLDVVTEKILIKTLNKIMLFTSILDITNIWHKISQYGYFI